MSNYFLPLVKTCIIAVYLIILAGAIVRMTDSGMGCPDWPKCFGHFIPPTQIEELQFKTNTEFKEGMIIIYGKALFVAKKDFKTSNLFNQTNWKPYTKHNYATFNATHTWVEYINRLVSAISGLFFIALIFVSFKFIKQKPLLTYLSIAALLLMLFEAWLGKTVVDSNLASSKIGIHMMVALAIVALLLIILNKSTRPPKKNYDKLFMSLGVLALSLTIVQILLGIEVRQFVDSALKQIGFSNKSTIELTENGQFLIHRSFSIAVLLINFWLAFRNKKKDLNFVLPIYIFAIVILEAISGVLMFYFNFPFGSQALHLLFAAILFGMQFYLVLEIFNCKFDRSTEESPLNV